MMIWADVNSSNIARIGYDAEASILEMEFKNGNAYEYYEVPQYEYDNLMVADSKGKYANKNIYKRYRQSRIR